METGIDYVRLLCKGFFALHLRCIWADYCCIMMIQTRTIVRVKNVKNPHKH